MRDLFDAHKLHFQNTFPMPYANRMEALDKLETMLLDNEQALIAAVNSDLVNVSRKKPSCSSSCLCCARYATASATSSAGCVPLK